MKHAHATIAQCLGQTGAAVHLAGICGIGMAGVAVLLKDRGFRVTGCDASPNTLAPWLRSRGIEVAQGHDPAHIRPDTAWVIRSAAVPAEAPEMRAARDRGLPVFARGEVLPALLAGQRSVAVAGTHGKTTTTSFIAQILTGAGRDPSFCIGGEVAPLGGCAGIGRGGLLVVEADESDGTLSLYHPDIAVITNIEFDHMEHFASVEAFEGVFGAVVSQARERVIYCLEDPRARRVCGGSPRGLAYGFEAGAALQAVDLELHADRLAYTLVRHGRAEGRSAVPAPGRHNAFNSLAAAAAGFELGQSFAEIQAGLSSVQLPRRRFDKFVDRADAVVISDYAHHPTEVAALVRTALQGEPRRTLAVFQPHRYTRTLALGADFPPAFAGVDELVLAPVYAASEAPLTGGSVWDLYAHFRAAGWEHVAVASSLTNAWEHLRAQLRHGDRLLVVGAGDVERIAFQARTELEAQPVANMNPAAAWRRGLAALGLRTTQIRVDEPLGPKTTFGVGGRADLWLEIGCLEDLAAVLAWSARERVPCHLLGGGSNVLVSDLGVRGVVARLTGAAFRELELRGGLLCAGAAVPLARLCATAEELALAGIESLRGIPGTVGGAVRGNAGAWGQDVGARVDWVRVLRRDGTEQRLSRAELDFGYRQCPALADCVIVEAALRLNPTPREQIRRAGDEVDSRRAWLRGLRCAGSVFRNPPGDFAGRLIEAAGLKGRRIGGAQISPLHANIFVAGDGARASDVRALMALAADAVQRGSGVTLHPEIILLE